jgi:hypothetical protein
MYNSSDCKLILDDFSLLTSTARQIFEMDSENIYISGYMLIKHLKEYIKNINQEKKVNIIFPSCKSEIKPLFYDLNNKKNISLRINTRGVHNILINDTGLLLVSYNYSSRGSVAGFLSNNENNIQEACLYFEELWNNGYALNTGKRDNR